LGGRSGVAVGARAEPHPDDAVPLRLGRLYVTECHRERDADVVLMLDTLSQVGVAPLTSLDFWADRARAE